MWYKQRFGAVYFDTMSDFFTSSCKSSRRTSHTLIMLTDLCSVVSNSSTLLLFLSVLSICQHDDVETIASAVKLTWCVDVVHFPYVNCCSCPLCGSSRCSSRNFCVLNVVLQSQHYNQTHFTAMSLFLHDANQHSVVHRIYFLNQTAIWKMFFSNVVFLTNITFSFHTTPEVFQLEIQARQPCAVQNKPIFVDEIQQIPVTVSFGCGQSECLVNLPPV